MTVKDEKYISRQSFDIRNVQVDICLRKYVYTLSM
jgi:hypothetical protein